MLIFSYLNPFHRYKARKISLLETTLHITRKKSGKKDRRSLSVSKCGPDECARRQDEALPLLFPRDATKSQLYNEQCFIHCLRMIAIGIDDGYQAAVETMVKDCNGEFKSTAIKGYGRMKNKCVSKDDHYHDPYPR